MFSSKIVIFYSRIWLLPPSPRNGRHSPSESPGRYRFFFFLTTSKPNLTSEIFWFTVDNRKNGVYAVVVLIAFPREKPCNHVTASPFVGFYLSTKVIAHATGSSRLNRVNELFRSALIKNTFYLKSFFNVNFFFFYYC